jgi:hypothetical protein
MIAKARNERDLSAEGYNAMKNKTTEYARSIEMVLAVREQVVALWESSPAKLPGEKCFNCEAALPAGCGGIFKDDGEACLLNRKGPPCAT